MSARKTIYAVFAPAEGDSPEDAAWWYFRTRDEAEDFANDGWGADYGVTNYSEAGPFMAEDQRVSSDIYAKTWFKTKTKLGAWEWKKAP